MKRIISTIYIWSVVALGAMSQPRFSSHTEQQNLGQIEWKHPVTATYQITNSGDAPLQLTHVEPDCACTMTQWTRTPIAPGAKGVVSVTFDAEALGRFHKSVAVYTNAQPAPVYLSLSGQVVQEIKDFTRTHPFLIGSIRIDKNSIEFPDLQHGESAVQYLGVANQSERPYEPVLMHLPPYLQADAQPTVLQPGEKGIIKLTLDSQRLTGLGLTQASVYLARFSGDKVAEENEIPLSAILLPDFSSLSEAERTNAPAVSLSQTEIDMSAALAKKKSARQDLTLTNNGRSILKVSKLQVFHPAVGVSLKKSELLPGESTRLRVTVRKQDIGKARHHLRLLMITNDPQQPKVEINIKAKP